MTTTYQVWCDICNKRIELDSDKVRVEVNFPYPASPLFKDAHVNCVPAGMRVPS